MSARAKLSARLAGLIAGFAVAAAFVVSGLTPASQAHLGAHVTIQSLPTGELAIEPEGRFLEATSLQPSGSAGAALGSSTLTNQTAIPLGLRARVLPSAANLDQLLRLRITAAGKLIFDGRLGELRDWTRRSFLLQSGDDAEVAVQAWLPATLGGPYEARGARLSLIWKTRPVEG